MPQQLKQVYEFPIDNKGEYPAIISFRPREIAPLDISKFVSNSADIARTVAEVSADGAEGQEGNSAADVANNVASEALEAALNIQPREPNLSIKRMDQGKLGDWSIQLRMPSAQNFNDTIGYQNADLGAIGAGVEAGMSNGSGMIASAASSMGNEAKGFIDAIVGTAGGSGGSLAALKVASRLNTQAAQGVSSATRVALNPNSRTLFQSVSSRSHSFTFKLVPNSAEEVERIKEIIKKFRVAMYPDEIGVGQIAVGYKFPDPFDITMKYKGKNVFTKILTSYLTNCQVTYNSAGQGFYDDGGFTDAQITLSFTEIRPLNKQDIAQMGR